MLQAHANITINSEVYPTYSKTLLMSKTKIQPGDATAKVCWRIFTPCWFQVVILNPRAIFFLTEFIWTNESPEYRAFRRWSDNVFRTTWRQLFIVEWEYMNQIMTMSKSNNALPSLTQISFDYTLRTCLPLKLSDQFDSTVMWLSW